MKLHTAYLMALLIVLIGCSRKSGERSQSSGHAKEKTAATSLQRVKLPFDKVEANWTLTGYGVSKLRGGRWDDQFDAPYETPVSPSGQIVSLSINGHEVLLKSTTVVNGIIETWDFGQIEVVMLSAASKELRATPAQINRMEEWLKKPPPLLSPFADLQKRANEGNPDAQYFLSLKYYQGEGVAQDRSEAYKWALVAASSGHKDAKNLLGELEIFMTEKEEAEGRTRAEALQANQRK